MRKLVAFIQNALLINNNDDRGIGLSRFKTEPDDFSINKGSLGSKDVKLSDLLRRS